MTDNAGRRPLPAGYWPAYASAWAAVGAGYMTIFILQGSDTRQALFAVANNTLSAALLGAMVVHWTGQPGLRPQGRLRSAAWAALLAGVFAWVWMSLIGVGMSLQILIRTGSWEWTPLTGSAVPWQLFAGVMVFVAVAASGFAARGWSALRAEGERAARAEAMRVRAELDSLRARLHPHFLFNTLHSVRTQVLYDPEEAARSLDELAGLLRYALRVTRDGVGEASLDEEWAVTERYIALERLRLGDRLRTRVDLSRESRRCRVPTFVLQPLIENAIRHGVATRSAGGTIDVRATVRDGTLMIAVSDDGPGANVEEVESASGLGLRGLRERLAVLYPEEGTVELETAPGCGFRVSVRMPAVFLEPQDETEPKDASVAAGWIR